MFCRPTENRNVRLMFTAYAVVGRILPAEVILRCFPQKRHLRGRLHEQARIGAFTWWLGHFISCYSTVHFMLIKYTFASKLQTLRMRYPFQSTGRPISHRNGWSFRVYMIPLRDFVPEWNSRPGARTGVNSRRGDLRRHNILWRYHVSKYRAMRGYRSELAPGRKSPWCHANTR